MRRTPALRALILGLNIPALVTAIVCYIWLGLGEVAAVTAVALNKIPTVVVMLREGARVFGAAVLGRGVPHNLLGHLVMDFYNARGIFGNGEDDLAGLEAALAGQFRDVAVWRRGTVALFTARC